jgi:hypothetical protein
MAGPTVQGSQFLRVSRNLPQAIADVNEAEQRGGRYAENYVLSLIRKQHLLADEGVYRVANNNNQSGITTNTGTAFVATVATAIIFNNDVVSNPAYKRIYLDFINLNTVAANTAASTAGSIQGAVYVDNGNRFSSGGTNLTANIISPNMDGASPTVASAYFGALTATAATAAVRAVNPFMFIRGAATGTAFDVAGENKLFNFGAVENTMNGSITVANANNIPIPLPPLIIGPQQCAILYLWYAAGTTNAAGTNAPTIAWWER